MEIQKLVKEPKQLANMTGDELNNQLLLAKKGGLFFYYVQGMILAKMKMDWETQGGDYFYQKYGSETYEEHIANFYDDKYSADTKIKDFYFMQYSKDKGVDEELVFGQKQSDQITQARYHLAALHGTATDKVQEYADNPEEVSQVLSIAKELGREFRTWRKQEEDGTNKNPVQAQTLSKTQRKAWAYDEAIKAMREHKEQVIGSARKQGIQECIDIMKDKLEEAKSK